MANVSRIFTVAVTDQSFIILFVESEPQLAIILRLLNTNEDNWRTLNKLVINSVICLWPQLDNFHNVSLLFFKCHSKRFSHSLSLDAVRLA